MLCVAPSRGRGLKQAYVDVVYIGLGVAPSRGRGLKHGLYGILLYYLESPLHGGVD